MRFDNHARTHRLSLSGISVIGLIDPINVNLGQLTPVSGSDQCDDGLLSTGIFNFQADDHAILILALPQRDWCSDNVAGGVGLFTIANDHVTALASRQILRRFGAVAPIVKHILGRIDIPRGIGHARRRLLDEVRDCKGRHLGHIRLGAVQRDLLAGCRGDLIPGNQTGGVSGQGFVLQDDVGDNMRDRIDHDIRRLAAGAVGSVNSCIEGYVHQVTPSCIFAKERKAALKSDCDLSVGAAHPPTLLPWALPQVGPAESVCPTLR